MVFGSRLHARSCRAPGSVLRTAVSKSSTDQPGATSWPMPLRKNRSGYSGFQIASPNGRRVEWPPRRPCAAAASKTSSANASSWTLTSLAGGAVCLLSQNVHVAGVACRFFDHVDHDPAKRVGHAVWTARVIVQVGGVYDLPASLDFSPV